MKISEFVKLLNIKILSLNTTWSPVNVCYC